MFLLLFNPASSPDFRHLSNINHGFKPTLYPLKESSSLLSSPKNHVRFFLKTIKIPSCTPDLFELECPGMGLGNQCV